jgi:hypothetical protein
MHEAARIKTSTRVFFRVHRALARNSRYIAPLLVTLKAWSSQLRLETYIRATPSDGSMRKKATSDHIRYAWIFASISLILRSFNRVHRLRKPIFCRYATARYGHGAFLCLQDGQRARYKRSIAGMPWHKRYTNW